MLLTSELSLQYPVPKTYEAARAVVAFLRGVDPVAGEEVLEASVGALGRICRAFPPLTDDCVQLLLTLAQWANTPELQSKVRSAATDMTKLAAGL